MKGQARWLAALACVMALAGCAMESRSGDSRTDQQRERSNEPDGMNRGGGGGGY